MLTSVEMKLLRLALDKRAYDGEAENAAVLLIRKLRSRNVEADELFSQTALSEYGYTVMTFGKYQDQMLKDIPISYLSWALGNCCNMNSTLRFAIQQFLTAI